MDELREELADINRKLENQAPSIRQFSAVMLITLVVIAVVSRVLAEYVMVAMGVRTSQNPVTIIVVTLIVIGVIIVLKTFVGN